MGKLIEKEGRFYKECGVVMLATNKPSVVGQLVRGVKGKVDVISVVVRSGVQPNESVTFNNLYITSDDEIKDGDWFVNLSTNEVHQAGRYADICHKPEDKHCKKIIATTDSSIGYTDHRVSPVPNFCEFPQPSDKFIQVYIEAYNRGEKIEKVLVEYDEYDGTTSISRDWGGKLKLKDNNIIIKKVKDSWTREEVEISHLQMAADITKHILCGGSFVTFDVSKWINENL